VVGFVIAYLDTHIAVWLHDGLLDRLSSAAKRRIEDSDLLVSPIVLLELQYLYERNRIAVEAVQMHVYLQTTFGVELCTYPLPAIVLSALACNWTSDPFDRLIVAHADANRGSPLITADTHIRKHYAAAVW
jgi:PIN domain nuclease of toxin-antitoxin system